jgi:putative endonuclease
MPRRALAPNRYSAQPNRYASMRSLRAVSMDVRHQLGRLGERLAAQHLERRGFAVIERNYQTRWGEIDIVAFDGQTLAFCEVKTRRLAPDGGSPFEAIRSDKRLRVRKMGGAWLRVKHDRPYAEIVRYDAIGVTFDLSGRLVSIEHLEDAF